MEIEHLLYPSVRNLLRLQEKLVSLLSRLPFVESLALFGSIAENRSDRWSDIDLYVACKNVEDVSWLAASAIRLGKPVSFYRMFSVTGQPSGRYWFSDESPFQKLDISFHSPADYHDLLSSSAQKGFGIEEINVVNSTKVDPADLPEPCSHLEVSSQEQEIGLWIRRVVDSLKAHLREKCELTETLSTVDGLRQATSRVDSGTVCAGGAVGHLSYCLLEMGEYLRTHSAEK